MFVEVFLSIFVALIIILLLVSLLYFSEKKLWDTLVGSKSNCKILILDGIQDPHNLGAISRSALAFGVDYIVIPKKRSAGITSGSIRASSGAIHTLNIIRVSNISNFSTLCRKIIMPQNSRTSFVMYCFWR